MLENLKKCEFGEQCLIYLGHVLVEEKLNIDRVKIEVINESPTPISMIEVKSFMGETQYLRKLIASFSALVATLHAITTKGKSFRWGKQQQRSFEELKKKTNHALVLTMPNL